MQTADVHLATGQASSENVEHLFEVKLVRGSHDHLVIVVLELGIRYLEVNAPSHLPVGLVDRISHFLSIDLGNDVKRWHFSSYHPVSELAAS